MTALVRHMPPPWLRAKRAVEARRGPAVVVCMHHDFRQVDLGDGPIRMFECRGCGRLLWWERATREWHEDRDPFEQIPYVELTEEMVIQEDK